MKAVRKGPKAPRTRLQTRHSGPSMPQTRLLAAVSRFDGTTTRITNQLKVQLSLAFSAAS